MSGPVKALYAVCAVGFVFAGLAMLGDTADDAAFAVAVVCTAIAFTLAGVVSADLYKQTALKPPAHAKALAHPRRRSAERAAHTRYPTTH